jgi:hypothetical protein
MSVEERSTVAAPEAAPDPDDAGKPNRSGLWLAIGMVLLLTVMVYMNMG